ncbi:MAG TPA: TIGR03564 family F420-dependent LLM class oxidoreductase [Thermomicrobiales bacterium]|nr:TIGR03564 family F420-dependent LLM class oxidoreductase [Thermomicrobiales bacterium]
MRIGVMAGGALQSAMRQIVEADEAGFASAWLSHIRGADALTVLALAGQQAQRIELGTFVIPTYPRHPSALAQQALTMQAATANRLTLGIGLSHRVSMEAQLGFDWDHPIRHMREYLTCLNPLLAQQRAHFEGEEFILRGYEITIPGAEPPPVLVAALGPQMLKLAGAMAHGTAIWMGGATYIAEHVIPRISAAASDAGRPAPRIVAGLPIAVTERGDEVRAKAAQVFERYGQLPSYRAILDREGAGTPADVALIGSDGEVRAGLQALADAGVTDFAASVFTPTGVDPEPTWSLLREYAVRA